MRFEKPSAGEVIQLAVIRLFTYVQSVEMSALRGI